MSLTVRINKFQLSKPKSNLLGRVEFRGVAHTTTELNCSTEFVDVNQSFIWPLARPADVDEAVVVELRQQTTKILLKTGIGGSATSRGGSRGTITSSTKIIGRFVLLMQGQLLLMLSPKFKQTIVVYRLISALDFKQLFFGF
ncbi:uncharacterized protein LOC131686631 [Topomyia yanbarensis]|uniref:uncharacterized protein LOC131686631 n=1 Tax=Topomyia yanbarensis TaxID=2498891 RepID=UPI00273C8AAC|nr:uncharacterized protein LOC131686631 [Topomyia yanbarensis]XP_058826548.1 uncharacterized protein LOC131686631 [Topomyia yanbarensis]XP_058826549.1 uncharacterized protein LOC131686631 [Topomyia yanbarensis]XP_058826550.1 uncharacterized protein LOC131686631 [Topomyia yanbarensis]XP_058826551.1 uncharacterized protein LOC131686631 [Topomyia yanbarensis]XP_058826552.1 uncharacterized protein LOC131686631 [Topomyia yanbarensis]XP_058826561.1 uncharacterized protein LOC131686631 [Topomyia yan